MGAELAVLQNELVIAKQQNQIIELQYKLQTSQAAKATKLEDSLFSPVLYEHYQKVAVMLAKTSIIPNAYKGKPEDIFVAMAMGYQLGFPVEQSLQDIAVVNGRPCLWGDGLLALALSHPECQSIDEQPIRDKNNNVVGYTCTVTRKGHQPHTKQFTLQDATVAGLLKKGGVWTAYPTRMLQMRARSLALRDKFADALRGIRIAEVEQEDASIIDAEPAVEASKVSTQTAKLKAILGINTNEKQGISDAIVSNSSNLELISDNQEGTQNESAEDSETNITNEQIDTITILLQEKKFSPNRVKQALRYYKVDVLEKLSSLQAHRLISQLEKV